MYKTDNLLVKCFAHGCESTVRRTMRDTDGFYVGYCLEHARDSVKGGMKRVRSMTFSIREKGEK